MSASTLPRPPAWDSAWLFVGPAVLFLILLFVYPFAYGFVLSFQPVEGDWLANYRKFFALVKKMNYRGTLRFMLPWLTADLDEIDAVFGGDPWPYGVVPNRPTLEALVRYLAEQGVIAKAPRVDDLFVPVHDLHA